MIKNILKQSLAFFNLEVRRRSCYFIDDFLDQKKLLSKQEVTSIFDVGANIGQTSTKYREIFPNATIYAFEPTEEAFIKLHSKFKDCSHVKPFKAAVSSQSGHQPFFIYQSSLINSLLPVTTNADLYVLPPSHDFLETTYVQTTTIDIFCVQENIDKINILKMDIQGGELIALNGASNLLQTKSIDLIYMEVLFGEQYENQANFHDISKFLKDHKYILYGIYNLTRNSDGTLGYADAIFISPNTQKNLNKLVRS